MGLVGVSSLRIDGQGQPSEGRVETLAFMLDYVQHLAPHVGVELLGSVGSTSSRWSEARGESRARAELAMGPVFAVERGRRTRFEWHVSLPVGYTFAWFGAGEDRIVSESYAHGAGLNFQLKTGLGIFARHHGGFIDVGYAFHVTWIDHRAHLISDPSISSTERYQYIEHAGFIGGGYTYLF